MTERRIEAGAGRTPGPLASLAVALVGTEAAVAALGGRLALLSGLALLVAPGLALAPLLPARIRASLTATVAAAPALGFAAASVALVTVSSAGVPLDPLVVRLTIAAVVVAGVLLLPGSREVSSAFPRSAQLGALGLVAAVCAGLVLEGRVIGGSPVPGNDWAKYVLYADEIRRQGALLIENPYWMRGMPFPEDPGAPSVYGAFLLLSGLGAAVTMHGIWVFAVTAILSTFAFVRAFWGEAAAVLAATLWAVIPMTQDMLGWHGLANAAALALLPLLLAFVTSLCRDGLDRREAAGLALVTVGLAAAHRLSFTVAAVAVAAALAVALAAAGERRRILAGIGATLVAVVALSPGVAYDLISRARAIGGTQGYRAYLDTKLDWGLVAEDLTPLFSIVALAAVVLALRWARRDRTLWPLLAALAAIVALGYGWVVHLPLSYLRMAYYLPLALVPLAAIALARLLPPRRLAIAGGLLAAAIFAVSWTQAANVRQFYGLANPASVRGLDTVSRALEPGETVVTDRCWSFLSTWLLRTPVLAALENEDILPKAELEPARQARTVLAGTAEGRRTARRLRVRFLLVDPVCRDAAGREAQPPAQGVPVFVSERLAVLALPRSRGQSDARAGRPGGRPPRAAAVPAAAGD